MRSGILYYLYVIISLILERDIGAQAIRSRGVCLHTVSTECLILRVDTMYALHLSPFAHGHRVV